MSLLSSFAVALALAMDAFAVALSSSVSLGRADIGHYVRMSLAFGFFQFAMPVIGWALGLSVRSWIEAWDHWIAFALLIFLGVKMIRDGISGDEEHHFDPTRLATVLTLSLAVSIDALAVGISFTCIGMDSIRQLGFPLFAIGLASFVLALTGCFIGSLVGNKLRFPVEPIGGLVLIILGIKILCEHLT